MTAEMILLLVLLLAALVLFVLEWLPVDVVTLLLLAALILTGILDASAAFSGFANEIIIILSSVFIISGAVVKTGIMGRLAGYMKRIPVSGDFPVIGTVMSFTASVSAFFSNTSATAILMPAAMEYSRGAGPGSGRVLMPLAYASILGGSCTLIGTSTNMAASGLLRRVGMDGFALFEFTAIGLLIATAGIVWISLVGYRSLPPRADRSLAEDYSVHSYLSEFIVPEESPLIGKGIGESGLLDREIESLAIIRGGRRLPPHPLRKIREGDVLIVLVTRQGVMSVKERGDLVIEADDEGASKHLLLAEAVVTPQSRLAGRALRQLAFRTRFGVSVLAIYRGGKPYPARIANMVLRPGDVLLLQGDQEQLEQLEGNTDLWGLTSMGASVAGPRRGFFILGLLGGALVAGATELLPLSVALLLAALGAVLLRCITMEEAYGFIEWRLIILIGGMTGAGLAMEQTGTAAFLAGHLVEWAVPLGTTVLLVSLVLLTMLLTQPMSNAAAALLVLPVAISAAQQTGLDPHALAVLVTLAASLSFLTPLEPACLLVYGPGKYRFRDFIRVGLPLTMISAAMLVLLVPVFWPLTG
jgi:di/tricarboxylate transporter